MSADKISDEDFGPGFEAVFKVIDGGMECTCEFVNIGVGYEKVAESPDCPRCTSFGMTMTILAALAGRLLPAGVEMRAEVAQLRRQVETEIGLTDIHRRNLADALGMTTHSIDMTSLIAIVRQERGLALARADEAADAYLRQREADVKALRALAAEPQMTTQRVWTDRGVYLEVAEALEALPLAASPEAKS